MATMISYRVDRLEVRVFENRQALGQAAAAAVAETLTRPCSAVFAAAPSQNETLAALGEAPGIDWHNIHAFHLDEYAQATPESPHSFRRYLTDHLFSKVPVGRFEGLRGEAADLAEECNRYTALLNMAYPTVGLLGIGENGHLAFNDPPAARFNEPALVRVVELTETCRQQQVHDKTFPDLEAVPRAALSLTIPALMKIEQLFVMVPGKWKAAAIHASLRGPICEACPASILRTHPRAILFLDRESASETTKGD